MGLCYKVAAYKNHLQEVMTVRQSMEMSEKQMFLQKRSHEKELLDLGSEYYSFREYFHCQKILFKINKLLGFFSYTKRFLKQFPPDLTILDVGCGGGLFILNLSSYFPKNQFVGCDISQDAISMAEEELKHYPNHNVSFVLQQQPELNPSEHNVDIILATLVCHHIDSAELSRFFKQALSISHKAVLINDLHRHVIPYFFYKLCSPIFRNRLINHDGLISIKRGFKRKEWIAILKKANINHYNIKWRFPFCWSIILWKK